MKKILIAIFFVSLMITRSVHGSDKEAAPLFYAYGMAQCGDVLAWANTTTANPNNSEAGGETLQNRVELLTYIAGFVSGFNQLNEAKKVNLDLRAIYDKVVNSCIRDKKGLFGNAFFAVVMDEATKRKRCPPLNHWY